MKQLHTEIEIDASAKRVWELLTDFASYLEWNPYIRSISGLPAPGERLQARLAPPGGRTITFKLGLHRGVTSLVSGSAFPI